MNDIEEQCRDKDLLDFPESQPIGEYTGPNSDTKKYTRCIDYHIHVRDSVGYQNESSFINREKRLINLVKGREIEIFNDPNVVYPYREYFNGVTGTMSNILTGGFFHLYYHVLMIKGIQINICTDISTMLEHIQNLNYVNGKFIISKQNLIVVKKIIDELMLRKKTSADPALKVFLTDSWWDNYIDVYRKMHQSLISNPSKEYYQKGVDFGSNLVGPTMNKLEKIITASSLIRYPVCESLQRRDGKIIADYPNRPEYLQTIKSNFKILNHSLQTCNTVGRKSYEQY